MPEVLDVQLEDDVDLESPPLQPAPPWRRLLGLALVVVLALAGAYSVFVQPRSSAPEDRTAQPDPAAASVLRATNLALEAWGQFAVSGNLDLVARTFDQSGPQFTRFIHESRLITPKPAGPPAYVFAMAAPKVMPGPNLRARIVRGEVVVTRDGEAERRYGWDLVMRNAAGRWVVWTVQTTKDKAAAPTPGARP
jgi:hypothetical protein